MAGADALKSSILNKPPVEAESGVGPAEALTLDLLEPPRSSCQHWCHWLFFLKQLGRPLYNGAGRLGNHKDWSWP